MQGTMHPYGDNFAIVVPVEDEILHTPDKPFCFVDPACPCHEDQTLLAAVAASVSRGLMTPAHATAFIAGRMV